MIKLSTKNIDKTIRTIRRSLNGEKVDTHKKCNICFEKIKKNKFLAIINGFGSFNYYHPQCLFNDNKRSTKEKRNS